MLQKVANDLEFGELIDTLWNVNVAILAQNLFRFSELIDTLWNVNKNVVNAFIAVEDRN